MVVSEKSTAERVLDCLFAIADGQRAFNIAHACSEIEGACLTAPALSAIAGSFSAQHKRSTVFDGQDLSELIGGIGVASVSQSLGGVADPFGFNQTSTPVVAFDSNLKRVEDVLPFLYAEYLNRELDRAGLPTLNKLRQDTTTVDEFHEFITAPDLGRHRVTSFVFNPIRADSSLLSMAVLFVFEYLERGPGFHLVSNPNELRSRTVLEAWRTNALERTSVMSASAAERELVTFVTLVSQAASTVFSPTGLANTSIDAFISDLQSKHLIPDAKWTDAGVRAYQSLAYQLLQQWTINLSSVDGFFFQGVNAAINVKTGETTRYFVPGDGVFPPYWVTVELDVYGEAFLNWEKASKFRYFKDEGNVKNKRNRNNGGGCFTPGTQVLTSSGSVNIEHLQEGQSVLTRADTQEYGCTSDEVVAVPAPDTVYGFNDVKPFFSANHVFFTTTGLRAIDPGAARAENPWLNVGELRVGHCLLHTHDGKTYEEVKINTITREACTSGLLHGVHLREGLRSYHANGYRVALNYPEITIRSLAAQLAEFPPSQKLRLLAHCHEILPLLQRFGGQTVLDALAAESTKKTHSGFTRAASGRSYDMRYFQHAYTLASEDGKAIDFELMDGVLRIDGAYCERAIINETEVHWTRPLTKNAWEHGFVRFYNGGLTARGYSHESKFPDDDHDLERKDVTALTVRPSAKAAYAYDVKWDTTPVPPSDATIKPSGPVPTSFTDMGKLYWEAHVGKIDTNRVRYTLYDTLRDDIVKYATDKLHEQGKKGNFSMIESLYTDTMWVDPLTGLETHRLDLDDVEMIIEASDQWLENPDVEEPVTKNLTFKKIGSNVVLPVLFNTMEICFNSPHSKITEPSNLRVYEALGDGCNGSQHLVQGAYVKSVDSLTKAVEEVSSSRNGGQKPMRSPFEPHAKPSPMTGRLRQIEADDLSTEKLAEIPWNQSQINVNTQTMLKNIMLWHMDEGPRNTFFSKKAPDNLPAMFTTLLDSKIKDWLKNTYANAYICQVLAETDASQLRRQFTAQEVKNIKYFWEGKGSKCLTRSQEYKILEKMITRYLVVTMHKLQPYKDDMNGEGGLVWSSRLLGDYGEGPGLEVVVGQTENARNMLTKLCTIMDALDNGTKHADNQTKSNNSNELVFAANAHQYGDVWKKQYWALDESEREEELNAQWTITAIKEIIYRLLNDDQEYTGEVYDNIKKQIAELVDAFNLKDIQNKRELANRLGDFVTSFIRSFIKIFGLAKTGGAAFLGFISNVAKSIGRVTPTIDKLIDYIKDPQVTKAAIALKGVMVLGCCAFFVWQANTAGNWESPAQLGRIVTNMMGTIRATAGFTLDFVEAVFTYRNQPRVDSIVRSVENTAVDKLAGKGATETTNLLDSIDGAPDVANKASKQVGEIADSPLTEVKLTKGKTVPADVAEALPSIRKKFSIARKALAVFGQLLAIAMAIFAAWCLAEEWDSLPDDVNRALQTVQVVLAGLEAIMSFILLVGEAVAAIAGAIGAAVAGPIAAGLAAIGSVFAAVTIVLAVVAVILMIALFLYNMYREPPLGPAEIFIEGPGKQFANSLTAPEPLVRIVGSPSDIPSDKTKKQTVTFQLFNDAAEAIKLSSVAITFNAGDDATALFYSANNFVNENTQKEVKDLNRFKVLPDYLASVYPINATRLIIGADEKEQKKLNQVSLVVSGPEKTLDNGSKEPTDLQLASGQSVTIEINAVVYAEKKSEVIVEVEEIGQDRDARATVKFSR